MSMILYFQPRRDNHHIKKKQQQQVIMTTVILLTLKSYYSGWCVASFSLNLFDECVPEIVFTVYISVIVWKCTKIKLKMTKGTLAAKTRRKKRRKKE